MHCSYNDIVDQLGTPQWWDERGVPRYCEFSTQHVANIYSQEIVFMLIACQACRQEFKVVMSYSSMGAVFGRRKISDRIKDGSIHYGDPPNFSCCSAGPTMNCEDLKILEYWHSGKDTEYVWTRNPALEINLPDAGASDSE